MRSFRPVSLDSLPNLLFNGGLDQMIGTSPCYWTISGLAPAGDPSGNSYSFVSGETQKTAEDLTEFLSLSVVKEFIGISQAFIADNSIAALDFPVPLQHSSARREVPAGYQSGYERVLGRSQTYTAGLSIRLRSGKVRIVAEMLNKDAIVVTTVDMATLTAGVGRSGWFRVSGQLVPTTTPAHVRFRIVSTGSELVGIDVGCFQLIVGAYEEAPYTGDLIKQSIPSGIIMLFTGSACPVGWVDIPDDGEPSAEWLAEDPNAATRHHAFPIGGGTGPQGAPTHNKDSYHFELAVDDVLSFESYDSTLGTTPDFYNPNAKTPADEPDEFGHADHQHNVKAGGSIPVNRTFRFCKKV